MPHYFDDQPNVNSSPGRVDVVLGDLSFSYTTDRGVFSRDRLDTGTRLLLRSAPTPPVRGNLLDLGCGAGPIALTLAQRAPDAVVWALDTNQRALELTRSNASQLQLDNIHIAVPSEVPDEVRFDTIWSNPPIRIGKSALHAILLRWLPRLTTEGEAILVVQKHLGADSLQKWLIDHGFETRRLSSKAGYRLLSSRRAAT